jgi:nucleotide-binding universal stress UspA family protein
MFKRIMVCSDGSDSALRAAGKAAEIAKRFDAHIILVHVFLSAEAIYPDGIVTAPDYAELTPEYKQQVQRSVEKYTGKIFDDAGVNYTFFGLTGHVVEQIVELAEQEQADLIVMGSRGRGRFQRFLLGSVTDGVIHHAHCPVMIVR